MIRKILIVIFWLSLILTFLYSPKIIKKFFYQDNELNIFTYSGVISPDVVKSFYEQTGYNVVVTTFETNEELVAKLKISNGKGYDLIVAADYATEIIKDSNLVQKIDLNKISNFKDIEPKLLKKYFDKKNEYSVPLFWTVYGLAYNKKEIVQVDPGWSLIFDNPGGKYKVCVTDDAREAMFLASLYLFGDFKLNEKRLKTITNLLLNQKKWVEIYSLARQDYFLLSNIVPISIINSEFMYRVYQESDDFEFIIPREGTLITIENIMITSSSSKAELAHQFIDYMLEPQNSLELADEYGYFPANVNTYSSINDIVKKMLNMVSYKSMNNMLRETLSRRKIEDLWLKVKAS